MNAVWRLAFAALLLLATGCDQEAQDAAISEEAGTSKQVFLLPEGLVEVSGLAAASEMSVYAHNDEHGIVYEVSLEDGSVVRAFALGEPTVKGDFEGIAVADDRVYLLTSKGQIYEAPIGKHGERVVHNVYDTGLRDVCEFEGLTVDTEPDAFLLLCKRSSADLEAGVVHIYRWSVNDREPPEAPWLSIPYNIESKKGKTLSIRPSAIERRPDGGFVVAVAQEYLLLEINPDNEITSVNKLKKKDHPQAEGITVMPSGAVVVADEGAHRGPGRITIYEGALE